MGIASWGENKLQIILRATSKVTHIVFRVDGVSDIQAIQGHESDFSRISQAVHFLKNFGPCPICVDNVMEESVEKEHK